jgi:hypothetical protein
MTTRCAGCGQIEPYPISQGEHWRRIGSGSRWDSPRYEPCGDVVDDTADEDEDEDDPDDPALAETVQRWIEQPDDPLND